jgi:hypothetical protein
MVQVEALSLFWAKLFYPSALVGGFYNGFKVSFFTIVGYQYVRMGVLCFWYYLVVSVCLCLLTSLGTRQCSVIHCIWKGSSHIVFFMSCLSCFSHFSSIIKNLGSIATVDILVNSEIEWSWQGDGGVDEFEHFLQQAEVG